MIISVVFDLAGVLIDWDPRYLYAKLLPDGAAVDAFLEHVCSPAWRSEQDRGRPLDEATAVLQAQFPDHSDLIAAYYGRWPEMLAGPIEGGVAVLSELATRHVPLYCLSNWSRATYEMMRPRFAFLESFNGVVLSGDVGVLKPDAAIFRELEQRYGLEPSTTIFADDSAKNIEGAARLGYDAIHFIDGPTLRLELVERGLLDPAPR